MFFSVTTDLVLSAIDGSNQQAVDLTGATVTAVASDRTVVDITVGSTVRLTASQVATLRVTISLLGYAAFTTNIGTERGNFVTVTLTPVLTLVVTADDGAGNPVDLADAQVEAVNLQNGLTIPARIQGSTAVIEVPALGIPFVEVSLSISAPGRQPYSVPFFSINTPFDSLEASLDGELLAWVSKCVNSYHCHCVHRRSDTLPESRR